MLLAGNLPGHMRPVELIRKKRDGGELTREEITFLVEGAARGTVPDYQLAAWLMAVVCRGMTRAETAWLTEAMLHSGDVMDFSTLPAAKVDKHSTGGVGDKTSLVIAPILAAAGLYVPMISGRGLGHTGGTLDKLEAIPGFRVNLSLEEFRAALTVCRCALGGQTPEIAPADKKLYALRDVTGTVESPALICASIMSKKLAEGIDALVLDVKTGDGAFMKKEADAIALAELLVDTGKQMGKRVVALITDMDQPLGRTIGNALEVQECLEVLNGDGPEDLRELCLELSAWMLLLGKRVPDVAAGRKLAQEMIASGQARDTFRRVVRQQGGDERVVDEPSRLPRAHHTETLRSKHDGFVAQIACERIGVASLVLGGGREKQDDAIDPAVGIVLEKKMGDAVKSGETLCIVHYNADARLQEAIAMLEGSFVVRAQAPPARAPLIRKIVGA
ncbi:MAG TPA: thymidine phosphorylase [Candidatus Acidoferrales bacterium]|nr:thymidine phosphorylase [Candidatus Acidoferrales bacterium]